jgi:hypothetical protein
MQSVYPRGERGAMLKEGDQAPVVTGTSYDGRKFDPDGTLRKIYAKW